MRPRQANVGSLRWEILRHLVHTLIPDLLRLALSGIIDSLVEELVEIEVVAGKKAYCVGLEEHGLIGDFRSWKNIEAEGPSEVLLTFIAPMEGTDADLESCEFLHLELYLLVALFDRIVLTVVVI